MNHTRNTPEIRLWCAIIKQALDDAETMGARQSTRPHSEACRDNYLVKDACILIWQCENRWMKQICKFAHVSHKLLVHEIKRRLKPLLEDV